MRVAIDTNIFVYAAGVDEGERQKIAAHYLKALNDHKRFAAIQVMGEFYRVLRRKLKFATSDAAELVNRHRAELEIIETTDEIFDIALELSRTHQFDIWDAIIFAAAVSARCEILLTEDGHDGFQWRGVTLINPFAGELHPLAVHLLGGR